MMVKIIANVLLDINIKTKIHVNNVKMVKYHKPDNLVNYVHKMIQTQPQINYIQIVYVKMDTD